MKKIFFFSLFLLVFFNKMEATKYGGEMYYECLGEGITANSKKYKISFDFFSECGGFNSQTYVLADLYEGTNEYQQFDDIKLYLDTIIFIDNPNFSCISIPPNTCLEKRSFSGEVELPIVDSNYIFTFRSCCRNYDLVNLPGSFLSITGFINYVEITPAAQQSCNSSPVFSNLPSTVFCQSESFNLNHSAIDADGDLLIYKLYAPHGKFSETGYIDLAYPPPYPLVTYNVPDYDYLYPLGLNSSIEIDALTGVLSGVANEAGQYLVGVAVEEYRNGVLLSIVRRDFQFNIAECTPHVSTDITNSDEFIDDNYVFNLCNENQLTLQNQSTDTNYINNFFWTFDIDNQIDTFYEWNPTITFPHSGTFTGQLLLNPGEECADTANIIVNVSESLQADFAIDYDTCVGGEVDFTDQSIGQGVSIEDWSWDFGDSIWSELPSPQHQYLQPGTQTTTLIIIDENGCQDTLIKNFDWLPAPPIIIIAPSAFEGCLPLNVFFENLSSPVDSTYEVLWDFGNGNTSTEISPEYVYPSEGVYDVSINITSSIGCQIDTIFYDLIKVTSAPQANFGWMEEEVSNLQSRVHFQDLSSEEVIAWEWKVNQQVFSEEQNPIFVFQDTGYQQIMLTVFDEYNCQDSLILTLDVIPASTYFLPNAFTPNGDGVNDIFLGKGILENIQFFEMLIFNRWGEVIFQTNNPNQGWNGMNFKSGKMANQGVYTCIAKYRTARNISQQFQQSLILIR